VKGVKEVKAFMASLLHGWDQRQIRAAKALQHGTGDGQEQGTMKKQEASSSLGDRSLRST
jgi:hypothetical protein